MKNDSTSGQAANPEKKKPEEATEPKTDKKLERPRVMSAVARGRGGPNDPDDK